MPKQAMVLVVAVLAGLGLLGCEAVSGVLTPAPTYTNYPTQTAYPTYTLYPTYTPFPGPTAVPPTATPIPATATPVPSPVPVATFFADQDRDGFGDPASFVLAQSPPVGYVTDDSDCDDMDPGVNPNAVEVLDNKDNDCDGQIDEGLTSATYYLDNDGDGFGNPTSPVVSDSPPIGYVTDNTDCDDNDLTVNPGAAEVLDNKDNDCDGQIDEGLASTTYYPDNDGDGFGDQASPVVSGSPPAGYVTDNTDCDDSDANVNPAAAEILDTVDNDCDGEVDEGLASATYYPDNDGDGYGDPASPLVSESPPPGYVTDNTDCDDTNITVNPGARERDDDIDHNCNGVANDL